MSAHAVAVDDIVCRTTLYAPRGSSGNGADRCASPGALAATHDSPYGRSAKTAAHCAANGAAT